VLLTSVQHFVSFVVSEGGISERGWAEKSYNSRGCYVVTAHHSQETGGNVSFPSSCRIRAEELSLYPGRLVWSCNGMNGWAWLFRVGSRSGGWIRTAFTTYFARIMHLTVLIRSLPCCLCVGPACAIVKISVFSVGGVSLLVHNKMERSTQKLTLVVALILGIQRYNWRGAELDSYCCYLHLKYVR
jgi:hypothetical protein